MTFNPEAMQVFAYDPDPRQDCAMKGVALGLVTLRPQAPPHDGFA